MLHKVRQWYCRATSTIYKRIWQLRDKLETNGVFCDFILSCFWADILFCNTMFGKLPVSVTILLGVLFCTRTFSNWKDIFWQQYYFCIRTVTRSNIYLRWIKHIIVFDEQSYKTVETFRVRRCNCVLLCAVWLTEIVYRSNYMGHV